MSNATLERIHAHKRNRAERMSRRIFLIRTEPERFDPLVVESIQAAREYTIDTLGDVVDWDCYRCRRAVVTGSLADPCPHCGSQNGVAQAVR